MAILYTDCCRDIRKGNRRAINRNLNGVTDDSASVNTHAQTELDLKPNNHIASCLQSVIVHSLAYRRIAYPDNNM